MTLSQAGVLPDVAAGLALAMVAYTSTNLDNLVLITSAAGRIENRRAVIKGFLLSSTAVLGMSAAFVVISGILSPQTLGWLGLIPLFIGIRILLKLKSEQEQTELAAIGFWPVGLALLANSTDTIVVFGPLLAESEPAALFALLAGYILMAGLWITLALRLSERLARANVLGIVARWATPIFMIAIGIYILMDTTTDTLVVSP